MTGEAGEVRYGVQPDEGRRSVWRRSKTHLGRGGGAEGGPTNAGAGNDCRVWRC